MCLRVTYPPLNDTRLLWWNINSLLSYTGGNRPSRRFPYLLFWRETYPQTCSLSSCQYVSTITENKTACYRPLKNRHFVRVCTEKMMDHQYRENGARNIYSNYNQMRAYAECSPNQSKKLYLIDLSIEQSTKLWGFRNSGGGCFCIWILPE